MPSCSLHPLPYLADPAGYFSAVRHAPGAVLLDSARPVAERGRFDLLSAWPLQTFIPAVGETGEAYLHRLRAGLASLGAADLPEGCELPFAGGLIGYLAYDFGRRLEHLPATREAQFSLPDAQLGLYNWALASDHQLQRSYLVFHPSLALPERQRLIALFAQPAPRLPQTFSLTEAFANEVSAPAYQRAFAQVQAYIRAGDTYQINLTRRFAGRCQGDPWGAYQALRAACPTPYSGFMQVDAHTAILSHSPERFIRVQGTAVDTRPIKGTRPRRETPEADAAEAAALLASEKDRAENLMIVDLLRNDLGRSCALGTVRVPELFALESYPNVHHLVSSVIGQLAPGKDALDLLAGSFPGGSVTGAPKIRSMQIIDELEQQRRAIYCGSLLYLDVRGNLDSSIAIRTLLIEQDRIACWGGGAVVMDSRAEDEYQESLIKVQVLMATLAALQSDPAIGDAI
ncbi:aminodeoxychorismate synthase component I [Pseudomonas sp. RIT-PI-S]|uniref:aminodeoxychorismate synthase component I n=1 Tax=Pseudomonas sp. RIT-PI-S TaxID=3035295 RepID=UPI0021D9CAA2|nr:aminodeoxychorismate synthase component I [Pseudomonas sp. RIT-PI-S]